MRVGIIAFQHESNTFASAPTPLENFRRDTLLTGETIREKFARSHHEVAGFFAGLKEAKLEAVPLVMAMTWPSGTITADAEAHILGLMRVQLASAGRLNGLLLAPHGAGVSQAHRDMDGHWLTMVRQIVGPKTPIVCTLDAHANVSPAMIAACDATIAYRTNPHMDQEAIGVQAARLLARTLRGEVRPTQALAAPPVAISIDKQETAAEPCAPLYALADRILQLPGVLSDSVILGFPYADVEELGSSFIVVTDNDPALARRCAEELSAYLVSHRHEFACGLAEVSAAVREAAGGGERVCLLDVGDNVGGGSPADGTVLAHEIHRTGSGPAFVSLCDVESVERARAAGVGARLELLLGGKTDDRHGPPLRAAVTVRGLYAGRFTEPNPRHGGRTEYDMGPTAVVQTQSRLTVQLTSRRIPPFSLGQVRSCDLDPASFKMLVAKGVNAPIAAYREVCTKMIRVNTPGITCADMTKFPFQHRRRPLFPFEEV